MKNKKRAAAIIAGATAVSALVVTGVTLYVNAATKVSSFTVSKDSIGQEIELNGTIQSDLSKTSYAAVDAKVAKVYVKVGDSVKKGDLLVSFDEDRIEYLKSMAEYQAQVSEGNYSNTIEMGNRTQALYNEANINLGVLNQQIADTEAAILAKEHELTERKAKLAGDGAKIQIALIDKSGDASAAGEVKDLQKDAENNAYAQYANSDIIRLQEEIAQLNADLAGFKEYKQEMVSQKAATNTARLTSGQKEQMEAAKAQCELTTEETLKNLELAKNGIRAEYDGIITAINVEEGAEIARGMSLVTVASSDDIIVKCSVNKYDILSIKEGQIVSTKIGNTDYAGTVTRIEKIAGADGSTPGVGVDVKLDQPDDSIILGLDVKSKVSVAAAEDTICIPKNAAVEEEDGTYVFVEKDKKAVKKSVETGVKNDDMIEITSGLNEGDVVIWNDDAEIKEGMDVKSR